MSRIWSNTYCQRIVVTSIANILRLPSNHNLHSQILKVIIILHSLATLRKRLTLPFQRTWLSSPAQHWFLLILEYVISRVLKVSPFQTMVFDFSILILILQWCFVMSQRGATCLERGSQWEEFVEPQLYMNQYVKNCRFIFYSLIFFHKLKTSIAKLNQNTTNTDESTQLEWK